MEWTRRVRVSGMRTVPGRNPPDFLARALAPDMLWGLFMSARVMGVLLVLSLVGCAKEAPPPAPEKPAVDLSEEARREAVLAAATKHFAATVQDTLLSRGVTVRGLARAAARGDRRAAGRLSPAKYDATASSSAKVEIVNKKIVYTAAAQSTDPAAAVIEHGAEKWVLAWEIEAELTPDGELGDVVFLRVGEPRKLDVTAVR